MGPLSELATRHQGEGVDPLYVKSKRVHKTPFICLKESKLGVNTVLGIYIFFSYIIYIYIYKSIGKETREGEEKALRKVGAA